MKVSLPNDSLKLSPKETRPGLSYRSPKPCQTAIGKVSGDVLSREGRLGAARLGVTVSRSSAQVANKVNDNNIQTAVSRTN